MACSTGFLSTSYGASVHWLHQGWLLEMSLPRLDLQPGRKLCQAAHGAECQGGIPQPGGAVGAVGLLCCRHHYKILSIYCSNCSDYCCMIMVCYGHLYDF